MKIFPILTDTNGRVNHSNFDIIYEEIKISIKWVAIQIGGNFFFDEMYGDEYQSIFDGAMMIDGSNNDNDII